MNDDKYDNNVNQKLGDAAFSLSSDDDSLTTRKETDSTKKEEEADVEILIVGDTDESDSDVMERLSRSFHRIED